MKNFFEIEIIKKRDVVPDNYFLSKLEKNFKELFEIKSEIVNINNKTILKIEFQSIDNVINIVSKNLSIFEIALDGFLLSEEIDKFHYFKRVLKDREKRISNKDDQYLIVKYTSELMPLFQDYYSFLNRFFPIAKILCFFETISEGFLVYFERKIDFEDFLFNFTSETEKSLIKKMDEKNIHLKDDIYNKLIKNIFNQD